MMERKEHGTIVFTVPDGWVDQSRVVICSQNPDGALAITPTFDAARHDLPDDLAGMGYEGLEIFSNRYLGRLKNAFDTIEIIVSPGESPNRALQEILFTCTVDGSGITQWVTLSFLGQNRVLITTAGASQERFHELEATFRDMRHSLRFS